MFYSIAQSDFPIDEYHDIVQIFGENSVTYEACDTFYKSLLVAREYYGPMIRPINIFDAICSYALEKFGGLALCVLEFFGISNKEEFFKVYSIMYDLGYLPPDTDEYLKEVMDAEDLDVVLAFEKYQFYECD